MTRNRNEPNYEVQSRTGPAGWETKSRFHSLTISQSFAARAARDGGEWRVVHIITGGIVWESSKL